MKKIGAYIYTRVSTEIQTEGYSLDAQRQRIIAYAEYRGFAVRGEYSDAGFSGKNIDGRLQFKQMLDDIAVKKDDVKFVLVFKLSRFGRNAADVLSSLQFMQDYGVNLICVEDNIDSSADSGKLMISVMAAMAEIERENILVQTMAGRKQKASNGGWNGGIAPYGYVLENGQLKVVEDEARVVRDTFELYIDTRKGATYVAKELNKRYTKKIRLPSDVTRYTTDFVKRTLDNPVYMGRIAYGRTVSEKIEGKRNQYHRVTQKDDSKIIYADGGHEAIVSAETWELAHRIRQDRAFKPEKIDKDHHYILSGLVRCPECGNRMYGRHNGIKKREDGTPYASSYSYVCRTKFQETSVVCNKSVSYSEKKLLKAVRDIIAALVTDKGFDEMVDKKLGAELNTDNLTADLEATNKELRRLQRLQQQIENQLNGIDYEQKSAQKLEESLTNRLIRVLEDITEAEARVASISERLENEVSMHNVKKDIYMMLRHFTIVYDEMSEEDKKSFLRAIIDSIEVYHKNPTGQLIKKIHFKFPMCTKDGKEYSSIFFDIGGDDGSGGPGGSGPKDGGNGGGDFRTLTDDCLHIDVGVQKFGAAYPHICGIVQQLLRAAG